jgi:hypothetical protein
MAGSMPIEPLRPEECLDPDVQAFLQGTQQGWILNPKLMGLYARVPEGLKGWRRMVEGLVDTIGPVTWEVIAHRTAAVTGNVYETTHADETVRKEVAALRAEVCSAELDAAALGRRHYLAAALAEGVARHEVSPELFQELQDEFATDELVGLCMAASLAHVAQLVSDTLGVSPEPTS